MNSYLTLIGSLVIGGMFLLGVLGFQNEVQGHSYNHLNETIAQQYAMDATELLERDFRRIGYEAKDESFALVDTSSIIFYADIDNDTVVDTISYSLSDLAAASSTPNPVDRLLYRSVNNNAAVNIASGVTDFKLKYFDGNGNETNVISEIKSVETTIEIASTVPYDDTYPVFHWRKKITPPNLLF